MLWFADVTVIEVIDNGKRKRLSHPESIASSYFGGNLTWRKTPQHISETDEL